MATMANIGEAPVTEVVKISGNDHVRDGVGAFLLIDLSRWDIEVALPIETRNDLIRGVVTDVWKSLTAGSHHISRIETCMFYPDMIYSYGKAVQRGDDWRPPVNMTCEKSADLTMWAIQWLPCQEPIVVAWVTDCDKSAQMFAKIKQRPNVLALHKLEYPYVQSAGMLEAVYGRDPEGTIEIKKKPDIPAVSAQNL